MTSGTSIPGSANPSYGWKALRGLHAHCPCLSLGHLPGWPTGPLPATSTVTWGSRRPADTAPSAVTQGAACLPTSQGHTGQEGPQLAPLAAKSCTSQRADPGMPGPLWLHGPAPAAQTSLNLQQKPVRRGLMAIFNLYFPLPFGPRSTPGQLSNLEVELHLSVNDGAGEGAVMRRHA